MVEDNGRYHTYHSEAGVLHGRLQLPLMQDILPQAYAFLFPRGGYLSQHAHGYRLEGVVSFDSAYTQVAGNRDVKDGHGWSTVSTSVVENLNVLDVVTADRVVGQITTEHPLVGYVPHISFLGTRFENLRIAGHRVDLDLDHEFLGERPRDDSAYTMDKNLMERIGKQSKQIEEVEPFEGSELEHFYAPPTAVPGEDDDVENPDYEESVEGSLVTGVNLDQADDSYPGKCFNHVIDVPNFGKIYLATVHVKHSKFKGNVPKKTAVSLSMIKMKMGCIAAGKASAINTRINAGSHP